MTGEFPDAGSAEAVLAAFNDPSVMTLVVEGPEQVVVAINQTVRDVYGEHPLLGRPYAEAMDSVTTNHFAELIARVHDSGESITKHGWELEYHPPGGVRRSTYVNLALRPWRDEGDAVRGVVAHVVDVADQVRRQREADQSTAVEREQAQARGLMLTLQDTLLPNGLPILPGLQTAGRYLLAEADSAAGGDWFDLVIRPGGRVALVVGDVVSHGVAASATMGQLRAVLDEHLGVGEDLGRTLAALDRYAAGSPDAYAATVVVVDLDLETGEYDYCTAGHPPPLVLSGAESSFLPTTGAGPLGGGGEFRPMHGRLAVEELILLYSDGLIERPERTPPQATVELGQAASAASARPSSADDLLVDRVCQESLEQLVRSTGYSDDITLLAARRVPPVAPLQLSVPADPSAPQTVRDTLGHWLTPLHASMLDQIALQHAVGECVSIAVNQADSARAGPVEVRVSLDQTGDALLSVTKDPAVDDSHGVAAHGLALVNGLIDEVAVHRLPEATTMAMRHRLSRPVPLMQGSSVPGTPSWKESPFGTSADGSVLRVRGAVDLTAVEALREELLAITDGRRRRVAVDLAEVTLLSGVAVQSLLEARERTSRQGVELEFRAPPGSVAHHVLDLVHLPLKPTR